MRSILLLLLLLLSSLASLSFSTTLITLKDIKDEENQCVYTVYTRTGSIWNGGTDSVISLSLATADGRGFTITDLESWGGLMGSGYNYYERGNLDIFSGRGPCLSSVPCWMNLTSDGSGLHHEWYCNYVEVTSTGPHMGCSQQLFTVEEWLATDTLLFQLFAVRDVCPLADRPSVSVNGQVMRGNARRARAGRAGA